MKARKGSLFAALLLCAGMLFFPMKASSSTMGIGIMIGDPTGLTFRMGNFPIIGLAWSLNNHLHVHCDYWFLNKPFFHTPLNWYLGAGAKFLFFDHPDNGPFKDEDSGFGLGIRVPVGLQFYPIGELELFLEAVPGIYLIPGTSFSLDWGLGIRYHF